MNKKDIILIVSAVLVACALAAVVIVPNRKPVIEISTEKTTYGETGYFTVSASDFKDIAGAQFAVEFDNSALTVTEITNGNVFDSVSVSEEDYANNNGVIEVMYLDYSGGDKPITLDGDLLYVRYEVIKPADCPLLLRNVKFVDSTMEYISRFRTVDGKVKTDAVH